jgi:hypothetical protein
MEVAVKLDARRAVVMIVLDRKANRPDRNFITEFYSAIRTFENRDSAGCDALPRGKRCRAKLQRKVVCEA